jgi:hypothetical protein
MQNAAPPLISVPLTAFLGLFTEASPDALPEGVSPLNWDCDFDIGLVTIRPCLQSAFSFGGSSTGPNACTVGSSPLVGDAPWMNPGNIITNAAYATCIPGFGQTTAFVTAGAGQNRETFYNTWQNPSYVTQSVNYATFTLGAAGTSAGLECSGFSFGTISSASIVGVQVSISAYVVAPPSYFGSIQAQLMINGSPTGQIKSVSPSSSSPVTFTFGGDTDDWGTVISTADTIGVELSAVISATGGTVTFYVNNVQMALSYSVGTSNPLLAQTFGFSIPNLAINGISIGITGHYTGTVSFTAQLLKAGVPVGTPQPFSLMATVDSRTIVGGPTFGWNAGLAYTDVNNTGFGAQIIATASDTTSEAFIKLVDCTVSQVTGTQNFNWFKTYEQTAGSISTLALDSNGTIWDENVLSSPGQLTSIFTEIQPGTFAKSVTMDDVEYICFSNLKNGTDVPMQWTGTYFDRISQVGPGAPPAVSFTSTSYTIEASPNGLIQPAAVVNSSGGVPIRALLWSTGPSVKNKAGNVITIEYTLATSAPDPNIQDGYVVYLQGFADVNGVSPNGSYVVISTQTTNTGNSPRNSFSVVAPSTQLAYVTPPTSASYQMSIATVTTTAPVPLLVPGMQAVIAGASGSTWDGTYTIIAELNGAQLSIIDTSLTSDVATYQYSLVSGIGPAWTASTVYATGSVIVDPNGFLQKATTGGTSGTVLPTFNATPGGTTTDNSVTWTNENTSNLQVTVTGTVNGGGIFNVTNAIITSAVGNTFTISLIAPNVASAAEQGSAIINGSEFQFDPGLLVVGTGTSPILGNSGGGTLVVAGNIGAGTRQAVTIFLTRNGYLSACSTPVTFTTTGGAETLVFTKIAVGPPNVIARWIAITAAGPNGIAGPNFYVIPTPVTIVDNGQNVTYSATVINDNVTTQASFTFTDEVLIAADEIDIQGNNLFEQTELGSCTGNIAFANRMFYWGIQNKVPNFINMSFDGGYLPSTGNLLPLGWTIDPANLTSGSGSLVASPIFGNAYQISNQSGSTQNSFGIISQPAYQDYYKIPIININTLYSIRLTIASPNGAAFGNFAVDLYSPSFNLIYGQFIIPLATIPTDMTPFTGTLLTTQLATVPADLVLRVYDTNVPTGTVIQIDRIEIFPTAQPNLTNFVVGSYVGNFEAFDLEQGPIDASIYNQQPVTSCFTLFNSMYIVKTGSFLSTTDNGTTEPWEWTLNEVSASVGTPSINGVDYSNNLSEGGESYALIAGRAGLYIFQGGEPVCLSGDIRTLWNAINWQYGYTLWVRNDIIRRRILVGVPLPTPNAWLPNAPSNPNPITPNVILAMSYKQVNTVSELIERATVRASSFTGKLIATDISRKWSIWQIQAPYGDFIERQNLSTPLFLGNSKGTGKVYQLTEGATNDDGAAVNQFYCTYGFVKPDAEQGLQLGSVRHTYEYMTYLASGNGSLGIAVCPDVLNGPYTDTLIPISLSANPNWDTECPLNEVGRRLFVQFSTNAVGSYFSLSSMVVMLKQDSWSPTRGVN